MFVTEGAQPWAIKRIKRTVKRLFLGAKDRGLQFINTGTVKNEAKNLYLFVFI